jgi:hypothetical protein
MAEYDRSATGPLPVDAGPRRAESIFDLSPEDFRASLGEMQALGHDTDALMRQYRAVNSPFAGINNAAAAQQQGLADSGRRSVLGGLLSKPEGAMGMDAIMGLEREGWRGLLGAGQQVGQAFDAPAAAAQGLIPQADVNMEALNTAGMAMGAGGASAGRGVLDYDPNTTRMFAGPNARNADLDAMQRAEAALSGGIDRADVLRDTGWFRGADGKMRFEIDDSGAVLRGPLSNLFNNGEVGTNVRADVNAGLLHQELLGGNRRGDVFEPAYDNLGYGFLNSIRRGGDQVDGSYRASTGDIEIGAPNPQEGKSVLFHELQHAIQQNEGFARGSSPANEMSELAAARNVRKRELVSQMDSIASEEGLSGYRPTHPRLAPLQDEYDGLLSGNAADSVAARDAYNRSSGEVEARNTSLRSAMSTERRLETPPWETQDVPDAEQIVRFNTDNINANASQSGGLLGASLSEAQRQARDILDMRAAGRAGEVTDDMMGRADDQYMFDNTPLPMDEASRLARADQRLPDDQYHATMGDFQAFQPSQTGLSGKGIYSGDFGGELDSYATASHNSNDGVNVIPIRTPAFETYARNIDWQNTADADANFPYNATMQETIDGFSRAADTLEGQGFAGVKSQAGERVTFNPTSIRSRFARFDPEFSHLSNLSAANASPTAGLLASGAQEQDKPLPFMEMLRGLLR